MQGVCGELERCRTPDDQDVVEGLIKKLLAKLPEDLVEKEHEKTLRANGLCRVRCVQRLTEEKLEALGISMGDAMVLLDVLHAAAPPTPTAGAPAERVANVTPKRPSMRPFPKCGPTRYPDLEGWDPYKTGLGLRSAPEMTPQAVAVLRQVLDGDPVPDDWANGCPADVVLFTELVNGTGAMPDDLLKLLPKALKDAHAGMRVLQHLNSRVAAISEAATAVQEEEFRAQKAVLEGKRHMLASVVAVWRRLRDDLQQKQAAQTEAQQRRSLYRMIDKLLEVKTRMEASVAAHKVMHPGTELPVATMELVLDEFASKYSSVATVEGAYSLQLMEAFGVQPAEAMMGEEQQPQQQKQDDRKNIPCRFWKVGTCWRKSKCPWRHDGKPGETPPPSYNANVTQRQIQHHMDQWLAEKAAGVSALLGVCHQVAEDMIVAALQEQKVKHHHRASDCLGQQPGVALMVVADTGATVRVIGGTDSSKAVNVRLLPRPVPVRGAGGETMVERMGDLPGYGGLMRDCLIMADCAHSLLPVPLVCEEKGWGYQIDQGNTGSRFTAEGETVVQLEAKGGMAVLPEEMVLPAPREVHQLEVAGVAPARGSWEHMWCWPEGEVQQPEVAGSVSTEVQGSEAAGAKVQPPEVSKDMEFSKDMPRELSEESDYSDSEVQCMVCEPEEQSLHTVLVAEGAGLVAYGLQSRQVVEPSWMSEHEKQGHPYRKDCPWCVQGRLRQKQHCRQTAGSGTVLAGSTVKVDLTGPYEPGVTGSTWALVGVHEESDWGYVGLQQSKAAAASLVSIQSMEVQLRADSGGKAEPIARFHHDITTPNLEKLGNEDMVKMP